MINDRIKNLREQSLNAPNTISAERALLVTEFYQQQGIGGLSIAMQRGLCFKYIFENKKICILDDELIVGERGPSPKATPTYPEICVHSLEDLETLHSREKVSFSVSDDVKQTYRDIIIPFWTGRSHRERLVENMTQEWHDAYSSGIFTEFQEQRAPGHTVLGDIIYRKGMLDIIADIKHSIKKLDFFNDNKAYEKREELNAMKATAEALINFAHRHADKLETLADSCENETRKLELEHMAKICRRVPANKPETFHEALQYYWFVHLGVITELNPWDAFNPGRLDQHLYPYYKKELEAGTLTKEKAYELLQAFWIKFNNHPAPPKVGITAQESSTYTDFCLINVGGLTPDGKDAVNEMSYMILDVVADMQMVQPSSMVQISKMNPDRFVHHTIKVVRKGFGQPSIFNTDGLINQLLRQGKDIVDARKGGCSGCVETGAFGTEKYGLTGYFNLAKVFEITINNGRDPVTGREIGLQTGNPATFESFDDLLEAFKRQVNHFINIKIQGNNIIERLYSDFLPVPFLSLLVEGCIEGGKDYNSGGAKYNTSYIQGVGLGSLTDIMTSVKYHIFDNNTFTFAELQSALEANWNGFEAMRKQAVHHTPKYGNDDDYADEQAISIFDIFYDSVNGRPTSTGGVFRINMLPTTCHVYFGKVIGASADGRKAGIPLSEGISPFHGSDTNGPTAVIKSASKIDHLRTGGTLLNQRFSPSFFKDDTSIRQVASLVRSYFKMDGHHIQFNVVDSRTLQKAKAKPEDYRDLIVRVAGYSDYFNDLGEELQDEIIRRTAHEVF
ncbi:trans-4-hydroxy-L-proline dehydratase [Aureibacter tunicatorum]|uniref:Formate C-acetyltransferase n=1 Tax=Aureibacter tunicatorum TaxID=866807 RepID=A0AAE4BRL0_9BACT|nr:trans-4-hydroxy-L-proline dehydratase [Aureibacter tunicatorum]MDR6237925.1 formate C-acetyltransferase [Aureibacter tunicatorum]BDD02958.1 glycyl radical enzyme [Aureibacter tunicatorum]